MTKHFLIRALFFGLSINMIFMLSACTAKVQKAEQKERAEFIAPKETAQEQAPAPIAEQSCVLVVEVGGKKFYANFEQNASSEALIEQLSQAPITISMDDYGGFEKVGALPWSLVRSDEQIHTVPGDVILYEGDKITVYYGENDWNFTRLAHIENAAKETLLDAFGSGSAEVTFSLEWSE